MNKNRAVLINKRDNVAVVLSPVCEGEKVSIYYNDRLLKNIVAQSDIPIYHKIAMVNLDTGLEIYKYGEVIGKMVVPAKEGSHVHVRELKGVTI